MCPDKQKMLAREETAELQSITCAKSRMKGMSCDEEMLQMVIALARIKCDGTTAACVSDARIFKTPTSVA